MTALAIRDPLYGVESYRGDVATRAVGKKGAAPAV